jgi:hypothetical protein
MRQSLGTAVFSGMIGVTLLGVFLTPVFHLLLIWLWERRPVVPTSHPPVDETARKALPSRESSNRMSKWRSL